MLNTISDLENAQWVVIIIWLKFYLSEPGDRVEDSLWGSALEQAGRPESKEIQTRWEDLK